MNNTETVWQFIQQISNNPLWTLAGLAIGLIGLVFGVIFYKSAKREKKPTFFIRSSNLIADFSSKLAKLQILYDSKGIESLTVSKIAFWNDGAQTIDKGDIAEAEPLRIVLKEGYEILDVSVISTKNEANRFDVAQLEGGNAVKISFDYLDKHEGGVIQLIHTGRGSSDIEVLGIVKGFGKPRSRYYPLPTPIPNWVRSLIARHSRRFAGILAVAIAIQMIIVAIILKGIYIKIWALIMALMYGFMGYHLFKRRIPPGFDIVEEEI